MGSSRKKILFITPYPHAEAPSQRFRFEQYFDALKANGFEIHQEPYWDLKTWEILYAKGKWLQKILGVIRAMFKRLLIIFKAPAYDFIFIHREFSPIGYPIIPLLIAKLLRKKIIFDFDDAIWIPNVSNSNRVFGFLKMYSNTSRFIKWSYKVSCGNDYLKNFALTYNSSSFFIPTTIDTNYHTPSVKKPDKRNFIIGWTGTHSTMKYLDELIPVFEKIIHNYPHVEIHVISNKDPEWNIPNLRFIQWNKENEIQDLSHFDVGVMPLEHDAWSEGKCGFKALQYLSIGVPAIASPVGVNTKIIQEGTNGFLCLTPQEWEEKISLLITNNEVLVNLQKNCRSSIMDIYSVKANTPHFLNLFD